MATAHIHMEWMGEEILSCPVCYEEYLKPRILPCFHSFCLDCLTRHYAAGRSLNNGLLVCPNCRLTIALPGDGVKGFKKDKSVGIKKDMVKNLIRRFPRKQCLDDISDVGGKRDNGVTWDIERSSDSDSESIPESMDTESLASVISRTSVMSLLRDMSFRGSDSQVSSRPPSPVYAATVEMQKQTLKNHSEELCKFLVKARQRALFLYETEDPREEEKIYKHVFPVKAVFELVEEVIENCTGEQLQVIYEKLISKIEETTKRLSQISMEGYLSKSIPRLVPSAPALEHSAVPNLVPSAPSLEQSEDIHETTYSWRPQYSESRPDPKKMSFRHLFKFGTYGYKKGQFDFPTHASFTPDGHILVSDKHNSRLQFFNREGKFVKELCKHLVSPRRAMVSPVDGRIYVADERGECLKVFNDDGTLLFTVGEQNFQAVAGMTICPKLSDMYSVIVTDADGRSVVFISNPPEKIVRSHGVHQLHDKKIPCTLFCTSNASGQIFVSDIRNQVVRVYEHDKSRMVYEIKDLVTPRGLCVDQYGHLLIAESDKHQISMYNTSGRFVKVLLTSKDGLQHPNSLHMDGDGRLVVTQFGPLQNHEVLVFQMELDIC